MKSLKMIQVPLKAFKLAVALASDNGPTMPQVTTETNNNDISSEQATLIEGAKEHEVIMIKVAIELELIIQVIEVVLYTNDASCNRTNNNDKK